MGKGRGKGKKQSFAAALGDIAGVEDDKLPVRRRGRPQKSPKDKIVEGKTKTIVLEETKDDNLEGMKNGKTIVLEEAEDDNLERMRNSALSKSCKNLPQADTENGLKRKRPSQVMETENSVSMHTVIISKTNDNELIKVRVGYRPNGSRRKNSNPRRAAEVGFECK